MSYFIFNSNNTQFASKYTKGVVPKINEDKLNTNLFQWLLTYAIYNNLMNRDIAKMFFKLSLKHKEWNDIYKSYKLPDYTNYFLYSDPFFPLENFQKMEIEDKESALSACLKNGYSDKAFYLMEEKKLDMSKVTLYINKLPYLQSFYIMLLKKNMLTEENIKRLIQETVRHDAINLFKYMAENNILKKNINLENFIDSEGSLQLSELYKGIKQYKKVNPTYERKIFKSKRERAVNMLHRLNGSVTKENVLRFDHL